MGRLAAGSGLVPVVDRPDLDRRVRTDQHLGGLEQAVLVVGGDHVEARQLLGGLGVRAVGDQRRAVGAATYDARAAGGGQRRTTRDPATTLLEQSTELVVGLVDRHALGLRAALPLRVVVGGEQDH